MKYITDLFTNYIIISAATGWFTAQILKFFTGVFKLKKFTTVEFLFGTGGMPSSHSAAVTALCVSCGLRYGFDSGFFAIAFLFAIIVMRDATGVRWETGEQAKILNRIMKDLFTSSHHEDFNRNFKELVGHTPMQVFVGAAVGAALPFLMALIPLYRDMLVIHI